MTKLSIPHILNNQQAEPRWPEWELHSEPLATQCQNTYWAYSSVGFFPSFLLMLARPAHVPWLQRVSKIHIYPSQWRISPRGMGAWGLKSITTWLRSRVRRRHRRPEYPCWSVLHLRASVSQRQHVIRRLEFTNLPQWGISPWGMRGMRGIERLYPSSRGADSAVWQHQQLLSLKRLLRNRRTTLCYLFCISSWYWVRLAYNAYII